jgi:hypothetical protein
MKFLTDLRLLLVAIWLGAAVFFIGVAQSAFSVLPQREMAGLVVNRTLAILNFSGLGIFVVLLLTSFVRSALYKRPVLWAERILLLIAGAACAVGQFVFGFWIAMKRAEIGRPIDELAVDDPLRIQFNMLHEYSVWTLMVAMGAGFLAFWLVANRRPSTLKKDPLSVPYDFEKEYKI